MSAADIQRGEAIARKQIQRTEEAGVSDEARAVISACGASVSRQLIHCFALIGGLSPQEQNLAASLFIADVGDLIESLGQTAARHGS